MTSVTKAAKTCIEKISARVFCHMQHQGGGNPVTVFCAEQGLSSATQQGLAQTCEWESVMVNAKQRQMSFFMPTGEEVSFCAHAAVGGAFQLAQQSPSTTSSVSNSKKTNDEIGSVEFAPSQNPATIYHSTLHEHDIVSLDMNSVPWIETAVPHAPALHRLLRDCHGLERSDYVAMSSLSPTFLNSSIARPKTLIQIQSLDALHQAKAPPPASSDHFRIACDAMDSTGTYLYAEVLDDDDASPVVDDNATTTTTISNRRTFECRQFPRASGYPEDPATGIAAAALAVSLDHRQLVASSALSSGSSSRRYYFYQGTAMGQASLIMVENIVWGNTTIERSGASASTSGDDEDDEEQTVSFRLTGRVEVDRKETIEVDGE